MNSSNRNSGSNNTDNIDSILERDLEMIDFTNHKKIPPHRLSEETVKRGKIK